ncbi:uncharacterized protein LOC142240982 [Haematobia irritans]|uniref:uncharacterized protein LOC142240982 n=1 Tax=Haematobia irritans TaxID=7368 RepID=UPI003F4FCA8C
MDTYRIGILFVALFQVFLIVKSSEEEALKLASKCRKTYPITDEEYTRFVTSHMNPANDSENFKCFIECAMEETGIFVNDELHYDVLEHLLKDTHPEHHKKEIEAAHLCTKLGDNNTCHRAYDIFNCLEDILLTIDKW